MSNNYSEYNENESELESTFDEDENYIDNNLELDLQAIYEFKNSMVKYKVFYKEKIEIIK